MKASPNEKKQEKQKGPGSQDAVSSGRSELGQKKEKVNYGYENGISKPDAQRQDGENPNEEGRTKEWQDRARENLKQTSPDTITKIRENFEEKNDDDTTPEKEVHY